MATFEKRGESVFKEIDADGSGIISIEEFKTFYAEELKATGMLEDELSLMFDVYDSAGTARGLDYTEYSALVSDIFDR